MHVNTDVYVNVMHHFVYVMNRYLNNEVRLIILK